MNDVFDVNFDGLLRYDPQTLSVPAGATLEVVGNVSWVSFLSTSGADDLTVSFNNRNFFPLPVGLIIKSLKNKLIRRLYIRNPGVSANTVRISKGLGDFEDSRVVITSATVLRVNPVPLSFTDVYNNTSDIGAGTSTLEIFTGAANVNGVFIMGGSIVCESDTTALARLALAVGWILVQASDSQSLVIPVFTVPAGIGLNYTRTGACRVSVFYRIL